MHHEKTAKELAAAVGATLDGNGDLELSAVASPERAGPRDLIYADSAKNARELSLPPPLA